MFDLNHTREQFLAEINASEDAMDATITNPANPAFETSSEVHMLIKGQTPNELLPVLYDAFERRFSDVSHDHLKNDLLYLLKKGIGNAYKWGNQKDPAKQIAVEAVITDSGAFVRISDDGDGFDVKKVIKQFRKKEHYFHHGGAGIYQFEKTISLISYTNGGRTLKIRFLCAPEPGKAPSPEEAAAYGSAGDETLMSSLFSDNRQLVKSSQLTDDAKLVSCKVFVPHVQKEDGPENTSPTEIAYLLRFCDVASGKSQNLPVTGRLLDLSAVRTDFSVASQLHNLSFGDATASQIGVPKPVAMFETPPLALYQFSPDKYLRKHIKKISSDFGEMSNIIRMIANGLRKFHDSNIELAIHESIDDTFARFNAAKDRIINILAPVDLAKAEKFQQLFNQFALLRYNLHNVQPVPTFGDFGLNNILLDDDRFYFYFFDQCRYAHPAADLGGFTAGLLRFIMLREDENPDVYRAGRELFLKTYFAGEAPEWQADIPFFKAGALTLRLDQLLTRPQKKWLPKIDSLLDLYEQCI